MNFGVLDLGTTNTVGGHLKDSTGSLVRLGSNSLNARTALYSPHKGSEEDIIYGDDAIKEFLNNRKRESDKIGRLLTSPKSCLGTKDDLITHFAGINRNLTEILGLYISWAKGKIEALHQESLDAFIISHPVKFSENDEIHKKALERLKLAASLAGIKNIIFEAEPIAAARKYASDLHSEETFLIADAGGGTTDFSIVKAGPGGTFEVLASSGVYMGGNDFDGIVSDMLSPKLGSGGQFHDWGKTLDIPSTWYRRIKEWHNINPFLSSRDREQLCKISHGINNSATKLAFSRVVTILGDGMMHEWHEVCEGLKVNSSLGRRKKSEPIISHDAEEIIDWLPPEPDESELGGLYVQLRTYP